MPPTAPSRALEPAQILRRANLALVTQAKGAKTVLAELMGVSPAVLSHRLHGVKPVRDSDVNAVSSLLRLSPGWFDTPHQPSDVPADLEQRLNAALAQQPATIKAAPRPVVAQTLAPGPAAASSPPAVVAPKRDNSLKPAPSLPRVVAAPPVVVAELSPLADALLKTLSAKAHEGRLSDKAILKLLETVVGL